MHDYFAAISISDGAGLKRVVGSVVDSWRRWFSLFVRHIRVMSIEFTLFGESMLEDGRIERCHFVMLRLLLSRMFEAKTRSHDESQNCTDVRTSLVPGVVPPGWRQWAMEWLLI